MRKINFGSVINSVAALGAATIIAAVFGNSAAALSIDEIQQKAREMTVLIQGQNDPGSGVIIGQEGTTYYVLTAHHVIKSTNPGEEAEVTTCDGSVYSINTNAIQPLPNNIDLALIQFSTEKKIGTEKSKDFQPDCQSQVATLSNYNYPLYRNRNQFSSHSTVREQEKKPYIFLAGWPHQPEGDKPRFVFNPGILFDNVGTSISQPEVRQEGYELVYTNLSHPGMSGGPVLDTKGRLIGIHGRADGKKISPEDSNKIVGQGLNETGPVKVKIGFSLGIPIQTLLDLEQGTSIARKWKVLESSPPPSISTREIDSWQPPVSIEDRNNPLYWLDLGNQQWRLGRIASALSSFQQAEQINPDLYLTWFAKGFVYGFNGEYQEAYENCDRATKIEPNLYEAWRCSAGALQELGRFDNALVHLNKAIEINPNNPADFTTQGELRFYLGQYRGAIESFDEAIKIREDFRLPQSPLLYNNRGLARLELQQYQPALQDIERALAIDSNYAPAWENKGLALMLMEQYSESLVALDRAVELAPDDINSWHNRGATLYGMQRYEEALESFEKALAIDPNYQPAIEYLDALRSILNN